VGWPRHLLCSLIADIGEPYIVVRLVVRPQISENLKKQSATLDGRSTRPERKAPHVTLAFKPIHRT
jgi:hypothetical protein